MSIQTPFGHTLFLDGFQADSKVEKLKQLDLSKKASDPAPFDEKWLQYLAHNGKSLLLTALLADDAHKNGWIHAIADFQSAVKERSNDN